MAVLVEVFSVVIRREAIEARFNGGMEAFLRTIPSAAVCGDGGLIRVGFMDPRDVDAYVERLEAEGLTSCHEEMAIDLAVVHQDQGPAMSVPWLEFKKIETGGMRLSICWLAGNEPGRIAVPQDWTYETSASNSGARFVNAALVGDRLKFLRRENSVDVYLDLQTNEELYSGRPQIGGDTTGALQTQIVTMLHEAWAIDRKGPVPRPRLWRRADPRYRRLNNEMLPEIERIANGPGQQLMPAHFARGIVLRLLGRLADAEHAFRKANELAPGNVNVLRDLVRCLAEQRKPQDALPFAREAVSVDPVDKTLLGNLASCLMQCGEHEESLRVISQALDIDPNDHINRHIRDALLKRTSLG